MQTEGGTAGSGAESAGHAGMPLILLSRHSVLTVRTYGTRPLQDP